MHDETEIARRAMVLSGQPRQDLSTAAVKGEQTWDTGEMQAEFEVLDFVAPFVVVRRRSDGALGSLEFTHMPRTYFGWREHEE